MVRPHEIMNPLATLTALLGLATAATAADPPPTIDLSKLPGTLIDDVVIPVPREVFVSLDKLGDQDWNGQIKDSGFDKLGGRDQVALLFGVVVADGFVAVQAENRDAVTDIGRHVSRLAKALGVSDAVTAHANAIIESAEKDDWDGVRAELDRVQESVRSQMRAMRDENLADLVSTGGWLRGTEAASAVIRARYSKDAAEVLHQPSLSRHITNRLEKERRSKLAKAIVSELGEIQPLLELDSGMSEYAVEKIHAVSSALVGRIIANES